MQCTLKSPSWASPPSLPLMLWASGYSVLRESICSPLFAALRTICTNRILQITAGVAGSRSTRTPAFPTDSVVLLKLTGLLTRCKSNTDLNSYYVKSHHNWRLSKWRSHPWPLVSGWGTQLPRNAGIWELTHLAANEFHYLPTKWDYVSAQCFKCHLPALVSAHVKISFLVYYSRAEFVRLQRNWALLLLISDHSSTFLPQENRKWLVM